jgi:hypothetical protein
VTITAAAEVLVVLGELPVAAGLDELPQAAMASTVSAMVPARIARRRVLV